jgi:hypothetical protein
VGSCECGNEPSVSIKCGRFIDQLRNCQLLKKDSAVLCSIHSHSPNWQYIISDIWKSLLHEQAFTGRLLYCRLTGK